MLTLYFLRANDLEIFFAVTHLTIALRSLFILFIFSLFIYLVLTTFIIILIILIFAIFLFFLFIAIYLYKRCTLPTKLIIDALPAVAKDLRIVFSFLLVTAKAIVWHHLVF